MQPRKFCIDTFGVVLCYVQPSHALSLLYVISFVKILVLVPARHSMESWPQSSIPNKLLFCIMHRVSTLQQSCSLVPWFFKHVMSFSLESAANHLNFCDWFKLLEATQRPLTSCCVSASCNRQHSASQTQSCRPTQPPPHIYVSTVPLTLVPTGPLCLFPSAGEDFEVDMLLARKSYTDGRCKYLVRWAGRGATHDEWIPEANLNSPVHEYRMTAEVAMELGIRVDRFHGVETSAGMKKKGRQGLCLGLGGSHEAERGEERVETVMDVGAALKGKNGKEGGYEVVEVDVGDSEEENKGGMSWLGQIRAGVLFVVMWCLIKN